jgi:hypothetical protein
MAFLYANVFLITILQMKPKIESNELKAIYQLFCTYAKIIPNDIYNVLSNQIL